MDVLIGSQALNHYGRLKNRKPEDWDLLTFTEKSKKTIKGQTLDYSYCLKSNEPTTLEIYQYCLKHAKEKTLTPNGEEVLIAPLEILKVLKLSSIPIEKQKHHWDLLALEDIKLSLELENLAVKRLKETEARVALQKSEFFNKYKIERFFEHDLLHTWITNNTPKYKLVLKDNNPVEGCEDKFNKLSLADQKLIIWEEAFVLALERELVPKVRKVPMFLDLILDDFNDHEKSSAPALIMLSRLSIPGKLKDHPDWLALWAHKHSEELFKGYKEWWSEALENLPVEFWDKLLA